MKREKKKIKMEISSTRGVKVYIGRADISKRHSTIQQCISIQKNKLKMFGSKHIM